MSDPDATLHLLQQQIDELKAYRQIQVARDAEKAASEAALRSTAAKCAQGLVKLNVGGVKYTTSLSTLVALPDAYFGCLFSGDWELTKNEDREMFVDRDGEGFKYILQYLRAVHERQAFVIPRELGPDFLLVLASEAQFYGLQDLQESLQQAAAAATKTMTFEYKYIKLESDGKGDHMQTYNPVMTAHPAPQGFSFGAQPTPQSFGTPAAPQGFGAPARPQATRCVLWEDMEPVGSLQRLHEEGWQLLQSSAACDIGRQMCLLVLRRQL